LAHGRSHVEVDAAVCTEVHALDERLTLALDLRERIVAIEARLRS
jgi:hypothetical protein